MQRIATLLAILVFIPAAHAQWERIDTNIGLQDPYVPAFAAYDGAALYGAIFFNTAPFGFDLYRSTNDGTTWTELANFPDYSLASNFFEHVDGRLYLGALPGDGSEALFTHSDDGGTTWTETFAPGVGSPNTVGKRGTTFFAGTANVVARSTDDGATWQNLNGSPTSITRIVGIGANVLAHDANGLLFRSTDDGATWAEVLVDGDGASDRVSGLWRDGTMAYVKLSNQAIWSSADDGTTWTAQPTFDDDGIDNINLTFARAYPAADGTPWVLSNPNPFDQSLYLSEDDGETATDIIAGFPTNTFNGACFSVPTMTDAHVVAVATCNNDQTGIYRYQYATTLATEGVTPNVPLRLAAPYPNPTTGVLRLSYDLEQAGPARLTLYDILGREVALLRDRVHAAGAHNATVNTQELAPGLYVVRLATPEHNIVRRITVLR